MRPTVRAVVAVLALAAIAAAGAGAVHAASPVPTVGGKLSVTPTIVVVASTATLAQSVTLTVDPPEGATLTPNRLDLAPGEAATVAVTGAATGTVVAAFTAAGIEGEAVGIVLRAPFRTAPAPAPGLPILPAAGLGLLVLTIAAGLVIRHRRSRPATW